MMSRIHVVLCMSLILPSVGCADESQFQEGRQFIRLAQPLPVMSDNIEVLEFFRYSCPHCRDFEPYLQEWQRKLPERVVVTQIPAVMDQSSSVQAKAFYAAKELGVFEKVHAALFNAIHTERRPINTEEELMSLVKAQGIDERAFQDAMRSFQVDAEVRKAMQIIRAYRITGVPAVGINGRYLTGGGMVNGFSELLEVMDYLISMESRQSKSKSEPALPASADIVR